MQSFIPTRDKAALFAKAMVFFARRFPNDERVRDAFGLVLDILEVSHTVHSHMFPCKVFSCSAPSCNLGVENWLVSWRACGLR